MQYKIETKNNQRFIYIPELTEMGLLHCFTTKDMDIGLKTNGNVEDIKKNFDYIFDFIGVKPKEHYQGYQVHSGNVVNITDISQGSYYESTGKVFYDTDGLVTGIKNIALVSRFADCTPIILYDPIKKVQGNIHSGWKGTLQRIGANGIDIMVKEYGCNPEDIIAIIGPTIGKDDFEVESDVMTLFEKEFDFSREIIRQKNEIKFLIDLQTTNKKILLSKGIKDDNLHIIDLSTYSKADLLHSYRRDKDKFGLMGAITVMI
jgi:YfiH family protein